MGLYGSHASLLVTIIFKVLLPGFSFDKKTMKNPYKLRGVYVSSLSFMKF